MKPKGEIVYKGKYITGTHKVIIVFGVIFSCIILAVALGEFAYLVVPYFILSIFIHIVFATTNYQIIGEEIFIDGLLVKENKTIKFSDISYIYHSGSDASPTFSTVHLRIYNRENRLIYTLPFTQPDHEDIIKVLRYFKSKGVKLKIDKKYTDIRIINSLNEE